MGPSSVHDLPLSIFSVIEGEDCLVRVESHYCAYSEDELERLSTSLERIISNRELRVVFQPLVDLNTVTVFAYEVLARNTSGIFQSPTAMFEAAVAVGLCGELGRVLRELAVAECSHQLLFLNIHPNEFSWLKSDDPIFTQGERIYLELTESVPMEHPEECHRILNEARRHGVRLAVDDLGAGYSNLKYISDLNPEIVKLDRQLISGLTQGTRLHRLVTSIVNLSVDMGAKVVAEGIETSEELQAVIETGAHYGQGYLLARPGTPPPRPNWPF